MRIITHCCQTVAMPGMQAYWQLQQTGIEVSITEIHVEELMLLLAWWCSGRLACPWHRGHSPASARTKVDLPHPLGPATSTISPATPEIELAASD